MPDIFDQLAAQAQATPKPDIFARLAAQAQNPSDPWLSSGAPGPPGTVPLPVSHDLRGYTPDELNAPGNFQNPRTGQRSTVRGDLAQTPVLDAPTAGVAEIAQGAAQMTRSNQADQLRGLGHIAVGAVNVATPAMAGLAPLAPLDAAAWYALSKGSENLTANLGEKAGLNKEDAQLAGRVVGAAPLVYGFGKMAEGQLADAIDAHNTRAADLVAQDAAHGRGVDLGQQIAGPEIPLRGTSGLKVVPDDASAKGRPNYTVLDPNGKIVFGGNGREVQTWLASKGVERTPAILPEEPAPIVREAPAGDIFDQLAAKPSPLTADAGKVGETLTPPAAKPTEPDIFDKLAAPDEPNYQVKAAVEAPARPDGVRILSIEHNGQGIDGQHLVLAANPDYHQGHIPAFYDAFTPELEKRGLKPENVLGHADITPSSEDPGKIVSMGTFVDGPWQRKGIATAMYDHAEEVTGKPLIPAGVISDDGEKLQQAYQARKQGEEDQPSIKATKTARYAPPPDFVTNAARNGEALNPPMESPAVKPTPAEVQPASQPAVETPSTPTASSQTATSDRAAADPVVLRARLHELSEQIIDGSRSPAVATEHQAILSQLHTMGEPTYRDDEEVNPETPAAAPAEESHEPTVTTPRGIVEMPTSEIHADPARFQFKADTGGKSGTGEELKHLRKFNPDLAGVISVWKDPADGKAYVVNGHHRLELAKRTGEPTVSVRYLQAKTEAEARRTGALINIGEGRGTALDAAKVFRESSIRSGKLEEQYGVSLRGAVAHDGMALAKLAPALFDRVISGDLPVQRAVVIGETLSDHDEQKAALSLLDKAEERGRGLNNAEARELIRFVQQAPHTQQQTANRSLFGEDTIRKSLALEKAQVSAYIKQQLAATKKIFTLTGSAGNAEVLGKAGNVIKAEENQRIAQATSQVQAVYDKLSASAGPISDALDQAAKELAEGRKPANEVKQNALERVRTAVRETFTRERTAAHTGTMEAGGERSGSPSESGSGVARSAAGAARSGAGAHGEAPGSDSGEAGEGSLEERSGEPSEVDEKLKPETSERPTPTLSSKREEPFSFGASTVYHAVHAIYEPIALTEKDADTAIAHVSNLNGIEFLARISGYEPDEGAARVNGIHIAPDQLPVRASPAG